MIFHPLTILLLSSITDIFHSPCSSRRVSLHNSHDHILTIFHPFLHLLAPPPLWHHQTAILPLPPPVPPPLIFPFSLFFFIRRFHIVGDHIIGDIAFRLFGLSVVVLDFLLLCYWGSLSLPPLLPPLADPCAILSFFVNLRDGRDKKLIRYQFANVQ